MNISMFIERLEKQLQSLIDEELIADPGNTPYVNITIIYTENKIIKEKAIGVFLSIKRVKEPIIKPIPSTHRMEECVGLCKVLAASHLESADFDNNQIASLLTDYGYCDSFSIAPDIRFVISVVASPSDTIFCYTHAKNCVYICLE